MPPTTHPAITLEALEACPAAQDPSAVQEPTAVQDPSAVQEWAADLSVEQESQVDPLAAVLVLLLVD